MLHDQAFRLGDEAERLFRLNLLETQADAPLHGVVEDEIDPRNTCDGSQQRRHVRINDLHRQGSSCRRRGGEQKKRKAEQTASQQQSHSDPPWNGTAKIPSYRQIP